MHSVVFVIKATIGRLLCITADLIHSNILGKNKQVKAPDQPKGIKMSVW